MVKSAAEVETTGVFQNSKTVLAIQNLLQHMGHCQPPTIIRTDTSTTTGFVNDNTKMKWRKLRDMNLHWLRDKEFLKQFRILWEKGEHTGADYFTKHHSIKHRRKTTPDYVPD